MKKLKNNLPLQKIEWKAVDNVRLRTWEEYYSAGNPSKPEWQSKCRKATVSKNDSLACAGAIVDNGYSVNYFQCINNLDYLNILSC